MMIDLNEDGRRKLYEICTKLGAHELLGQLTEELGEAIQAVMEVKEAFGCTITQEQAWKLDRMVRKCGELIQAAQKARRAMSGTTPVSLNDALVHLSEECADVVVCIDTLIDAGLIDENGLQFIGRYKIDRWHRRVVLEDET